MNEQICLLKAQLTGNRCIISNCFNRETSLFTAKKSVRSHRHSLKGAATYRSLHRKTFQHLVFCGHLRVLFSYSSVHKSVNLSFLLVFHKQGILPLRNLRSRMSVIVSDSVPGVTVSVFLTSAHSHEIDSSLDLP